MQHWMVSNFFEGNSKEALRWLAKQEIPTGQFFSAIDNFAEKFASIPSDEILETVTFFQPGSEEQRSYLTTVAGHRFRALGKEAALEWALGLPEDLSLPALRKIGSAMDGLENVMPQVEALPPGPGQEALFLGAAIPSTFGMTPENRDTWYRGLPTNLQRRIDPLFESYGWPTSGSGN
jgi:hypothetical protein